MTVEFQAVKMAIGQQLPAIADAAMVNAGIAYNLDSNLSGAARFFKKIAGNTNLLALHASYIADQATAAGRSAVVFRGFVPPKGCILQLHTSQYEVMDIDDTIVQLDPILQESIADGTVFRLIAVPIKIMGQINAASLDIESDYFIVVGDTLQIAGTGYKVIEAQLNSAGRYSVVVDADLILDYDTAIPNFLIANPAYVSEIARIAGKVGPFDLVFPISTQFNKEFKLTVLLELMSQQSVIKSYTKSTSSATPLRFQIFELPLSHTSLVCADRIEGVMDYNGSAVGLGDGCRIEWREQFPSDQIQRWQVRLECEAPGHLVIRMGDKNLPQRVAVRAGVSSIALDGFARQKHLVDCLQIGYVASGPIADKYRSLVADQIATCWIREMTPEVIATHIRYTLLLESDSLYRGDHLLLCGPKVQPSLPDIGVCYISPDKLDAGFLLRRQ